MRAKLIFFTLILTRLDWYYYYYYYYYYFLIGWDWAHLVLLPLFGLLYQPQMTDDGDCGAIGGMWIGRGNRCTRRKPAPVLLLSTTNPTWPDPGSNPGRRGGKPATNRLRYGMATGLMLVLRQFIPLYYYDPRVFGYSGDLKLWRILHCTVSRQK
jgi:hypothetical protein